MRTYTIVRRPEDFSWDKVPALQVDNHQWVDPVPICVQARICYDDQALYVKMQAVEPDIRAEEHGITGMPCLDSCMEFFFSPVSGDRRYLNIEFNPNGCMFFGLACQPNRTIRTLPDPGLLQPQILRTDDGWTLEYQIPYSLIRHFFPSFSPAPAYAIRANCYKCGYMTAQKHFLTWNYIDLDTPNFHSPDYFGTMIFE